MGEELEFDRFVAEHQQELWEAIASLRGPEAANDALAEAFIQTWLRWDRVAEMENPVGYVYTIARNEASKVPITRGLPEPSPGGSIEFEPALEPALRALSPMQAQVVYLVEGFGWGLTDTARILGISVSTVRNHLNRALVNLRTALKVDTDV